MQVVSCPPASGRAARNSTAARGCAPPPPLRCSAEGARPDSAASRARADAATRASSAAGLQKAALSSGAASRAARASSAAALKKGARSSGAASRPRAGAAASSAAGLQESTRVSGAVSRPRAGAPAARAAGAESRPLPWEPREGRKGEARSTRRDKSMASAALGACARDGQGASCAGQGLLRLCSAESVWVLRATPPQFWESPPRAGAVCPDTDSEDVFGAHRPSESEFGQSPESTASGSWLSPGRGSHTSAH